MNKLDKYVVLSINTTGLDIKQDYINEIVAIKYENKKQTSEIHYSFGYESLEENKERLKNFIEGYIVVTHNTSYLKAFLDIDNEIVDTLKLAKQVFPNLKNYCVDNIGLYLNYDISKDTDLYNHTLLINKIYIEICDKLLDNEIKDYIIHNNDVTISSIQRKFLIGINRAKRLLETYH